MNLDWVMRRQNRQLSVRAHQNQRIKQGDVLEGAASLLPGASHK
jgi:hypothetical protein